MYCRGPSWGFYWPWQPWPPAADEPVACAIPSPASSRGTSPVLVVLSLVFFGLVVAAVVREERSEWRPIQVRFRDVLEQHGQVRAARAFTPGMRQLWLPELGRVDRCVTCHLGYEWAGILPASLGVPLAPHPPLPYLDAHPFPEFGCTVCHGGQGFATSTAAAHGDVEDWDEPLLDGGARRARRSHRGGADAAALQRMSPARRVHPRHGDHRSREGAVPEEQVPGLPRGGGPGRPEGSGADVHRRQESRALRLHARDGTAHGLQLARAAPDTRGRGEPGDDDAGLRVRTRRGARPGPAAAQLAPRELSAALSSRRPARSPRPASRRRRASRRRCRRSRAQRRAATSS